MSLDKFVWNEVYCNVSTLIDEVIKLRNSASIDSETLNEFYYDYWVTSDHLNNEVEVFEWWIVSPYLASRLKNRNELIIDYGINKIWGRTTTGQSITLDWVIEDIYKQLKEDPLNSK